MKIKRIFTFILMLAVLLTAFSSVSFAAEDEQVDLAECRVMVNGEGWNYFVLQDIDTPLTTDGLDISVVYAANEGIAIDEDLYELKVFFQSDYTEEGPVLEEADQFGVRDSEVGFSTYCVKAVARGGARGETDLSYFEVWDRYSFNYYGAQISFGDEYKEQAQNTWHDYYRVPETEIAEPTVCGIDGQPVPKELYTAAYYRVNEDAQTPEERYSTEHPLEGLPTEPGSYFVIVTGKTPYYGEGCVDFDIAVPVSTAVCIQRTAYDGEILYIPEGGDIYVRFDLDPYNGMIVGWRNDLFKDTGFGIDDDPTWFQDDSYAYAHIYANGKQVGDRAELIYNWYRTEDIFDSQGGMHWDTAVPVYNASVVIEVAEEPQSFAFIKDDDDRWYSGDTIWLKEGDEILFTFDLDYYDDWYLPDMDLSDLADKGFTVHDKLEQFENGGYVYHRITADGVEPGTVGEVSCKWYIFDDYFSGDLSDKPSFYPAAVKIGVKQGAILGDADDDGEVTILDATCIQRRLAGLPTEAFNEAAADADGDGEVTILDATAIQRYLAGLPANENIGK